MHKREIRTLLCAMLLGDGHLTPQGVFMADHSSKQKDLVLWKKQNIDSIFISKKLERTAVVWDSSHHDKRTNKVYQRSTVQLSWKSYLTHVRKWVYKNYQGKPIKDVTYLLKQISLGDRAKHIAIWLMDDGSEYRNKWTTEDGTIHLSNPIYKLCTQSFSKGQLVLITEWFKQQFDIAPVIVASGNNQYILHFSVRDTKRLFSLIKPYIEQIPSMRYKFRLSFERYAEQETPYRDDIVQTTTGTSQASES